MTAEIAVLNRNAVALAADSAVTLTLPEGPKIYQTNKLFTLSKFWPVGVMIYGNADFMDVPWETIIKQYRTHLDKRSFGRVEDYARDFLRYLERNSSFFSPDRQRDYCYRLALVWLMRLRTTLKKLIDEKIRSSGPVSERAVRSLFRNCVLEDISHLRQRKALERFSAVTPTS